MTRFPFISFIIPVYNVEKYVAQCITSCLTQDVSLADYELIIVNDGSTDRSLDVIMPFVDKYLNIVVINQSNQGLSVARNVGAKYAKGEYIWFIDSDDWVENNCLTRMLKVLKSNLPDILVTDFIEVTNEKNVDRFKYSNKSINCNSKKTYSGYEYLQMNNVRITAWSVVINRNFWQTNNFMFYPGILHEDTELMPKMYAEATKIQYYDAHPYYYRLNRTGSIMATISSKRVSSYLLIADRLFCYAEELNDKRSKLIYPYICNSLNACYDLIYVNKADKSKWCDIFNDFLIRKPNLLSSYLRTQSLKQTVSYVIYTFCPILTYEQKFRLTKKLYIYGNKLKKILRVK